MNFRQVFLALLVTSFFLHGCRDDKIVLLNSNIESYSNFQKYQKISFDDVVKFNNGFPYGMHLIDSTLIIFNATGKNSSFFYNLSLNDKVLGKGYLKGGRGAGKALGCISNGIIDNRWLWAYDITLKKILVTDIKKSNDSLAKVFTEYPVDKPLYMVEFLDTLSYFGVGDVDSDKKIQRFDLKSTKLIGEFGEFHNIKNDTPLSLIKSVYESYIFSQPGGNKLALAYRFTDVLEIYESETHQGNAIMGPEGFEPVYHKAMTNYGHAMGRTAKTRYAFVGGATTKKHIYLLFSGKLEKDENSHHAEYIFVYDWSGKPIKKMMLDREILCFTVSPDDRELFAYDYNSGFILKSIINDEN
ncbi:BF3164 family lipoprotein [Flagellimonas sp.]|uniref:BF3164 family lipoprotein n=1 Tax=Flagellimonas sp. TaxID=2058762 RepID=UPI003B51FFC5